MVTVHGLARRLPDPVRRRASAARRRLRQMRPVALLPHGAETPREVVVDTTHLGPIVDETVARVRRSMQPAGRDADYDLAYEHFDVLHFLLQVRHLWSTVGFDPLRQYLDNGPRAKASPEINFSMQAYLARYPERRHARGPSPYVHWLRSGKAAGEIGDPAPGLEGMAPVLGMQPTELADTLAGTRTDLQERLRHGTLGRMFARAAEVEPLIGEAWSETVRPTIPPLVSQAIVDQVVAMYQCQQAAGFAPARLVIVASDPRWGGGRRMEGHIAHALTGRLEPHDIVVIYTDEGGTAPPGRFPVGVREVDFATAVQDTDPIAAHRTLVELVRSFGADAVVNLNSRVMYEALTTYGKALAASERLFLLMFCNEQMPMGNWVGVPLRFFYRAFDLVEGVLTDSSYRRDWLVERHQLGVDDARRIHVLHAPVDPDTPAVTALAAADPSRPAQVFWAGRWDRQKRVDLALEIARRMPDVEFRMWGESVLTQGHTHEVPGNVRLEGAYGHISEIALSEADVWLYTSAWDGVPSQLLEVGMTGIPVVGSLVGGTGEVLDEKDSWPVVDIEDPDAYVRAIRDVLADRPAARDRAGALRERLLRDRTEAAFADHVAALLLREDAPQAEEDAR